MRRRKLTIPPAQCIRTGTNVRKVRLAYDLPPQLQTKPHNTMATKDNNNGGKGSSGSDNNKKGGSSSGSSSSSNKGGSRSSGSGDSRSSKKEKD